MVLKTKEENRTNAQDKPLRLRVELVHLFPLVVQKLSLLIITEFTKYKSNSLSKGITIYQNIQYKFVLLLSLRVILEMQCRRLVI